MTYAIAVRLQRGVVFAADTCTNAGIDNVSQFRKLHFWRRTGDRVLVLLTAGNLAVSQSVISIINEQLSPDAPTDRPTLMNVNSMYRAARLVGDAVREARPLDASKTGLSASCILGGQVGDEAPRLFQIYDEGADCFFAQRCRFFRPLWCRCLLPLPHGQGVGTMDRPHPLLSIRCAPRIYFPKNPEGVNSYILLVFRPPVARTAYLRGKPPVRAAPRGIAPACRVRDEEKSAPWPRFRRGTRRKVNANTGSAIFSSARKSERRQLADVAVIAISVLRG
jgi:hypothetical protein